MSSYFLKKVFPVTEMDCPTCTTTIKKELSKLDGVKDVRINFLYKRIYVSYDPSVIGIPDLEEKIEDLGYRLTYKKYEGAFESFLRVIGIGKNKEQRFRRVEDHNFEELVLRSNRPVLLLFTSTKCPSCRVLREKLKEALGRHEDEIYIFETNILETSIWEKYDVMSVPTVVLFIEGEEKKRRVGMLNTEEMREFLRKTVPL
jgi:copper chaperone CopZ/thiol-disulfide isomerase/thioredoxin